VRKKREKLTDALRDIPADRPGLPAKDSIVGVESFVSPQNDEYKIIHTTETDAYDEPPKPKKPRPRRRK
jgi:hypothetical protein